LPEQEPYSPDRNGNSARLLPLNGCHILVVEDEFLIADDISTILREAGANVIGPAASLPEGLRLAGDTEQIDAAVLNIDLGGVTVFPLADELQSRGVKFLFLTGYGVGHIPDKYAAIPCCAKPAPPGCVLDELTALLRPIAA
jgi:DNA-binding response OmpR family regulator